MYSPRHLPVLSLEDVTANFEQLKELLAELTGEDRGSALVKAIEERSKPGPWTPLVLGTKVEAFAGFQVPAIRSEAGGTVSRLRGVAKIKAAVELKAGETVATIAEGMRPLGTVVLVAETNSTFSLLSIPTTGVITSTVNAPTGTGIAFDGLTFNLT